MSTKPRKVFQIIMETLQQHFSQDKDEYHEIAEKIHKALERQVRLMRSPKLDTSFDSNPAKDFLRREYDKAIISQWRAELGKPLKYFGLPAWKMLDVIEWQGFTRQVYDNRT